MLSWMRQRLAAEAGISLVEMMVALMIFTVAAFALLGGLIASAQSVLDQQLRADATRVATQQLEAARFADFDDLDPGTENETVTTGNGREMAVERTVEWIDALNPESPTNEDVKLVTVTVSWSDRGRDREVTYTTAIAPPDPEIVGGQSITTTVSPGAVEVDADGVPADTVTVTAAPQGFAYLGNMTARWNRQDGTLATTQMSQVGATQTWAAELPEEDITWSLDFGDSVDVDITVVAGAREGEGVLTVFRPEDTAPGPTLTDATVTPEVIYLSNPPPPSTDCGTTWCTNVDAVSLSVKVTPFNDDQEVEQAYVEFDLRDAVGPTEYELTLEDDEETWSMLVPAGSLQFAPGSAKPFHFSAAYDGGQRSAIRTVLVEVTHQ